MKRIIVLFALLLVACERNVTTPTDNVVAYSGYESGITSSGESFTVWVEAVFNKDSGLATVYRVQDADTLQKAILPYNTNYDYFVLAGGKGRPIEQFTDFASYIEAVKFRYENCLVWYDDEKEYHTESIVFYGTLEDI